MKALFYRWVYVLSDFAIADLQNTVADFQRIREWAWIKGSRESLRLCNTRRVGRETFD